MSVQISPVYTGTSANDGTGDTLQNAFIKVNNSFSNVVTAVNSIQSTYANTTYGVFANITVTNRHVGSLNFYGSDTVYINGSAVATGAVSFPGGNVSLQSNFQAATTSTSSTTGAVVITGGLGVGGNINTQGILNVTNTTDSSGTGSGAIITSGGLSVTRNANFGAALSVATSIAVTGPLSACTATISSGTVSSGTNSGALIVTGGVGIGGALNVGGQVTIGNLIVTGNLTANTSGVITTAVIDLNTPVTLAALTSQTTSNIGTVFHYYDSAGSGDSHAFAGRMITGLGVLSNAFAYYSSVNYSDSAGGSPVGTQLGTIAGGSFYAGNATASTSTTTGALVVSGGAGIGGAAYIGSTLTVVASLTTNTVYATTVNAATIGNTSAAHVGATATLTGLVTAGTVNAATIGNTGASGTFNSISSGTITPNANNSVTSGTSSAWWNNLYSVTGNFNTININSGGIIPGANTSVNLGSSSTWFNNIYGVTFVGTSTSAKYADLAENYLTDQEYEPGTVVVVGGSAEVTACYDHGQDNVIGVISTDPAYLMNSGAVGQPIALKGRVPVKVWGSIMKGQRLSTSHQVGYAEYAAGAYSFAIALETDISLGAKLIEAIIL